MAIENRIRQRLDLQTTRRQQLEFKEQKRQAEKEEEEEFRRKVKASMHCLVNICLLTVSTVKQVEEVFLSSSQTELSNSNRLHAQFFVYDLFQIYFTLLFCHSTFSLRLFYCTVYVAKMVLRQLLKSWFCFQMLEKFAEDDRIEQMNAQKRRMKQLEHKRAVEKLIEDRRIQFQRERVRKNCHLYLVAVSSLKEF